jgi:hypothetical protein
VSRRIVSTGKRQCGKNGPGRSATPDRVAVARPRGSALSDPYHPRPAGGLLLGSVAGALTVLAIARLRRSYGPVDGALDRQVALQS